MPDAEAPAKPTVHIENWQRTGWNTLYGSVSDHPRFRDETVVNTSLILSPPEEVPLHEGDTVETRNTFYVLGKVRSVYNHD
jgi:hypothetical protein